MKNEMESRKFVLMSFGLGGHSAYYKCEHHAYLSGYMSPKNLQSEIDSGKYPAESMEGCILVDKCAIIESNPKLAFDAPMVDIRLKTPDRFHPTEVSPIMGEAIKGFGMAGLCLVKSKLDKTYEGMDTVPTEYYVEWWRERGATIGIVKNGVVNWEVPELKMIVE